MTPHNDVHTHPLESTPPASPACPRVLCRALCAECVYSCACSRLYFSHPRPPFPPRRCDSASIRMPSHDPQGGSGDPTFLSRSSHLYISDGVPAPHTQATHPRAKTPPQKPRIRARHPPLPRASPPPLLAFGVAALAAPNRPSAGRRPSPSGGIRPGGRRVGRGPFRGSCDPLRLPRRAATTLDDLDDDPPGSPVQRSGRADFFRCQVPPHIGLLWAGEKPK